MLYGDIDPTIKLEEVLKPLKESKTLTADKPADAGQKAQNGDVEMQPAEKLPTETTQAAPV